jgi:hypothetical protein
MKRKPETHGSGSVSRTIDGVELKEELGEISLADPSNGKLRIVNFLVDEMGKKLRLKEGDEVDVIVSSAELEPSFRDQIATWLPMI